jgi:tetratricopeptide (TPR) repeat protein
MKSLKTIIILGVLFIFSCNAKSTTAFTLQEKKVYSAAKTNYNAAYYNKMGIDYYIDRNFEKAEEYFKKAIDLDPAYPQSYNNLANVFYNNEKYEEAKKLLEDLITKKPDYTDSYVNLALIYRKTGDSDKELQYLNQALSTNPDSYNAYLQRGITYIKLNNDEKAKQDFATALEINPKSAEANKNLGMIFLKLGDYDKALVFLNNSLELNSSDQDILLSLVKIYTKTNIVDKSILMYKKLLELDPTNITYTKELAAIYFDNKRYTALIDLLASQTNENQEFISMTAISYLRLNSPANAAVYFKKLITLNPKRPIYHYYFSICCQYLNEDRQASAEFENAIKIQPVQLEDYLDFVKIYSDKKMFDYLYDVLKTGVKKFPDNSYLNYQLASYYELQGNEAKAKKIRDHYANMLLQKNK